MTGLNNVHIMAGVGDEKTDEAKSKTERE
jgi:hypothetical protein